MDNYKEVKNIIHNDLKITKEDIRQIIKDTVSEEITKVLNDEAFIHTLVQGHIKEVLSSEYVPPMWKRVFSLDTEIYNAVCNEVAEMVHGKLELKFKE